MKKLILLLIVGSIFVGIIAFLAGLLIEMRMK